MFDEVRDLFLIKELIFEILGVSDSTPKVIKV